MAKYQDYLSRVGSNRDRAALRGIFSMFLTDDNPPKLKDLELASIILSGAETTQVTISGACTTGILLSGAHTTGINITGAGTTGINISGAHTTAINIARATAKTAIRIGEWAASQAAGSAVVFATNMAGLDTSQLNIVAAFGESVADLTSAYSTSVIRGRHLVTAAADTVITHEVYGVMGQVVCKNASFNHYASGIMGTFEASNTLTHVMSGYVAACVTGRLGGAVLTCESGGLVAGVAAINNSSAHTATGIIAGFATHKTAAGIAWPYGIYLTPGSCTAGLVMGLKSSSAAVGHPIGVANSADNAGDKAIAVFADDANAVLATDAQGINSRCLVLHAQTGVYGMTALRGHLRVVASITPSASKGFYGTESYVEASGTYTIGDGSAFAVLAAAGACVELGGTPTIAANAVVCGLHITGKSLPGSPTGETVGILFQALAQGYEHAFGFTGVGATDGNGLSTGSDSTNVTHKIAVWINGVGTRYLHVFSD